MHKVELVARWDVPDRALNRFRDVGSSAGGAFDAASPTLPSEQPEDFIFVQFSVLIQE
jgi:hypothetical protein